MKARLLVLAVVLAASRADAKPAPKLIAAAASWDTPLAAMEIAGAPPDGAYVLVDTHGVIGAIAFDVVGQRDGCLHTAAFHLVDPPAAKPGEREHLAIVGPIDPARDHPRLLYTGLAVAGHSPSERAEEPLGVAPPSGVDPTYAIDLDGDGAADLIIATRQEHGPFVHGFAKVAMGNDVWARTGKRWSRSYKCRWTINDTIR